MYLFNQEFQRQLTHQQVRQIWVKEKYNITKLQKTFMSCTTKYDNLKHTVQGDNNTNENEGMVYVDF